MKIEINAVTDKQAIILLSFSIFLAGLLVASLGCLFWSGRQFFWSGDIIKQQTQHIIGVGCVAAGILIVFFACSLYANSEIN